MWLARLSFRLSSDAAIYYAKSFPGWISSRYSLRERGILGLLGPFDLDLGWRRKVTFKDSFLYGLPERPLAGIYHLPLRSFMVSRLISGGDSFYGWYLSERTPITRYAMLCYHSRGSRIIFFRVRSATCLVSLSHSQG